MTVTLEKFPRSKLRCCNKGYMYAHLPLVTLLALCYPSMLGLLSKSQLARCLISSSKGAFFWDYSGTDSICVLLGAIPFSE